MRFIAALCLKVMPSEVEIFVPARQAAKFPGACTSADRTMVASGAEGTIATRAGAAPETSTAAKEANVNAARNDRLGYGCGFMVLFRRADCALVLLYYRLVVSKHQLFVQIPSNTVGKPFKLIVTFDAVTEKKSSDGPQYNALVVRSIILRQRRDRKALGEPRGSPDGPKAGCAP